MTSKVSVDRDRLAEFCRHNGVRRLAVFGSALRDDFGPNSDVDVLVEFEPGRTPGLRFFRMQDELSRLFNRTVDRRYSLDVDCRSAKPTDSRLRRHRPRHRVADRDDDVPLLEKLLSGAIPE